MSEMVHIYGFGGASPKSVIVHVANGTGAIVTCTNGKKTITGTTDANGDAIFKLAKGAWTITAAKSGASVSQNVTVVADCTVNINLNRIPDFTYTGTYQIVDDNDNSITKSYGNWKIRFLTSGTLKFTNLNGAQNGIDIFLVGGGSNGSYGPNRNTGGNGGGGGYTATKKNITIYKDTSYSIVIGGAGGKTSAFSFTAAGGSGANGGSGGGAPTYNSETAGNGGSNGANGGSSSVGGRGGQGQGTTTREFGETSGKLYSGGGGGGTDDGSAGKGGNGGGGNGATGGNVGSKGETNRGGGGGGGGAGSSVDTGKAGGAGGSGIVIIRNKR